jgi:hypothetical protein
MEGKMSKMNLLGIEPDMIVEIKYNNNRGGKSVAKIIPKEFSFGIHHASSEDPQWLVTLMNLTSCQEQTLPLQKIVSWKPTLC